MITYQTFQKWELTFFFTIKTFFTVKAPTLTSVDVSFVLHRVVHFFFITPFRTCKMEYDCLVLKITFIAYTSLTR